MRWIRRRDGDAFHPGSPGGLYTCYCIFDDVEPEIWFGRTSGASNFEYLCERVLRRPRPKAEYRRLASALKANVLREERCYSPTEMAARTSAEPSAICDRAVRARIS